MRTASQNRGADPIQCISARNRSQRSTIRLNRPMTTTISVRSTERTKRVRSQTALATHHGMAASRSQRQKDADAVGLDAVDQIAADRQGETRGHAARRAGKAGDPFEGTLRQSQLPVRFHASSRAVREIGVEPGGDDEQGRQAQRDAYQRSPHPQPHHRLGLEQLRFLVFRWRGDHSHRPVPMQEEFTGSGGLPGRSVFLGPVRVSDHPLGGLVRTAEGVLDAETVGFELLPAHVRRDVDRLRSDEDDVAAGAG